MLEKPNLIIYGRVIALSPVQEKASAMEGNPNYKKRQLYLDCTRYDSITGIRYERENKPLLEFGGDNVLNKLEALKLEKDDVVCVSFAIQGNPYKDTKTGKTSVFTAIRCYDIELVRKAGQPMQVQQAAPVQEPAPVEQPQPQPQQTTEDGTDGLPF